MYCAPNVRASLGDHVPLKSLFFGLKKVKRFGKRRMKKKYITKNYITRLQGE